MREQMIVREEKGGKKTRRLLQAENKKERGRC